ncbi:hypothetical protein GV054_14020 [Marinomonas mediterranea]|uniref:hypothetical protein n=1 Tax=Marinomonas mediterranea TaxID=119864 RepID=UPI0023493117|nr:hypothetical protein [Marinomonas mediterranea]WCN14034.1 hypothetical protein GV054_14020 [Marinomonas mediterranea]
MIFSNSVRVSLVIVLPLAITWFGVQIQYQYFEMNSDPLPVIIGFLIGFCILITIDFKTQNIKKWSILSFIILMPLITLFTGLLATCSNGDCL